MSIVPPASATLVWAFPTRFDEVRCFVWEHAPSGWIIAVMFGDEALAIETAPTKWAMEAGVDLVWRGLLKSGLGNGAENRVLAAMSQPQSNPCNAGEEGDGAEASDVGGVMPGLSAARRSEAALLTHTPYRHSESSSTIAPTGPSRRRRRPH